MNFTLVRINPSDDEYEPQRRDLVLQPNLLKTDAFTVLPPLSPQIPGPPATANPYRILPPIVSRKRPSFVILQEVGSRQTSREPSPSGRVSPFRGCGFKPHSRDCSPSGGRKHRSRSRLPVATRTSKSASPTKPSGIPRPISRRISYSPNRTQQILTQLEQNASPKKAPRQTKSTENLLHTKQETLKKSQTSPNIVRPAKPPLARKPLLKTAASPGPVKTSLNKEKTQSAATNPDPSKTTNKIKMPTDKVQRLKPKSPGKSIPPKPMKKETTPLKSKSNIIPPKKSPSKSNLDLNKSPIKPISKQKTPKMTKKIPSNKSKENLAPTNDAKNAKSPKKGVKTPVPEKKLAAATHDEVANDTQVKEETHVEEASTENTDTPEEPVKPVQEPTKNTKRNVLTATSLLNALKKVTTQKESEPESANNEDDKKDLTHTDTSKSLPLTLGNTKMTESSATMIRTTTEPALAPVEPGFIPQIRSAMENNIAAEATDNGENVNKSEVVEEKTETKVELPTSVSELVSDVKQTASDVQKEADLVDKIETVPTSVVEQIEKIASPKPSPKPDHVIAVTKIEHSTPETSRIVNIKQESEADLLSADNSIQSDSNGMCKSSWLKESAEMTNKTVKMKPNTSTQHLLDVQKPSSFWQRFKRKCPSCSKKAKLPIASEAENKESKFRKCLQNVRTFKCKPNCSCFPKIGCQPCRDRRKTEMRQKSQDVRKKFGGKLFAKKVKSMEPKVKKTHSMDLNCEVTPRLTFKNRMSKCLGMLCCLNASFCLSTRNRCKRLACCNGCMRKKAKKETVDLRRKSTISGPKKRRWTRIFSDFPKLDVSFVEHASVMKGSIPVLPVPLAWICLILNVFLPGSGTFTSGIFCLCFGKPRFSVNDSIASRFGAFLVNLLVGGSQLFTVLFCLVGWGWSIWWGVMMLKMAKKNKRIQMAEQGLNLPYVTPVVDQNHDVERAIPLV